MLPLAGILWVVLGQGDHLNHKDISALGLHPHLMSVPFGGEGARERRLHLWWQSHTAVCLVKITLSPSCCSKRTQLHLCLHSDESTTWVWIQLLA